MLGYGAMPFHPWVTTVLSREIMEIMTWFALPFKCMKSLYSIHCMYMSYLFVIFVIAIGQILLHEAWTKVKKLGLILVMLKNRVLFCMSPHWVWKAEVSCLANAVPRRITTWHFIQTPARPTRSNRSPCQTLRRISRNSQFIRIIVPRSHDKPWNCFLNLFRPRCPDL